MLVLPLGRCTAIESLSVVPAASWRLSRIIFGLGSTDVVVTDLRAVHEYFLGRLGILGHRITLHTT